MQRDAEEYYRELGREYPARIRQLVPAYDDMVETLTALLAASVDGGDDGPEATSSGRPGGGTGRQEPSGVPSRILDLGIGEGTLASRVLEALPRIRLTGIDASGPMLERARERLTPHGDRVSLVRADLTELDPPGPLAAAYSSLTLHNLTRSEKTDLLERLRPRLEPGAPFVWADLVRHADPALQEHFTEERIAAARRAGCPEDFIAWNFEKEGADDVPLTLDETLEMAREVGFGRVSPVWLRGVFAVVLLRD